MDGIGIIGACASIALAIAIFAMFLAIAWAKELDERLKKLEKDNETTNQKRCV